jgi:hypothetical protein
MAYSDAVVNIKKRGEITRYGIMCAAAVLFRQSRCCANGVADRDKSTLY